MKLGFDIGYSGTHMTLPMDRILRAEALGFDSIWTAESGSNITANSAPAITVPQEKPQSRNDVADAHTHSDIAELTGSRYPSMT